MSRPVLLASVLVLCALPYAATTAHGAEAPDVMLQRGYDLAFNLDHDEALETLMHAVREHPNHPAVHRGIAAVTWLRILFLRGSILVDNYSVSPSREVKEPPRELVELFKTHIERSIELAEEAVKRSPEDDDAHYELGASVALAASYKASIEGNSLRALRQAKRAYSAHQKVLELDPQRKDGNLILGMYRYLVSTLPRAYRIVAYLVGFDGGKEVALRLIEEAAAYPGEAQAEAQIALVVLYNREHKYGAAQRALNDLKRRYPRNRLFWLESGSTWLRDERAAMAERTLLEGFSKLTSDSRERMFGEEEVWQLKRGSTLVAMGRAAEALPDLIAARDGNTGTWVKGHAHLELGKIADLEGDRLRAREEYDRGRKLCDQAKHRNCVDAARALKDQAYAID